MSRAGVANLLATTVVFSVLVAGCIGPPGNFGTAWMRNESKATVLVTIDQPSHGLLPGTQHETVAIPPWQKGMCQAIGEGINEGAVTIAVAGPSVPFPTQTTVNVISYPTDVLVIVDAAGAVHFSSGPLPPQTYPCQPYYGVVPTAGPDSPSETAGATSSPPPSPRTSLDCRIPAADCQPALGAVEATARLQVPAVALPPESVLVVTLDACAAIPDPPPTYNLCAAPSMPFGVRMIGLAAVTYRDGRGRAFMAITQAISGPAAGTMGAITLATASPT